MNPNVEELAELVKKMREWQKRFFGGDRSAEVVRVAKDWERKVDAAVKAVLHPPAPTLFDAADGEG